MLRLHKNSAAVATLWFSRNSLFGITDNFITKWASVCHIITSKTMYFTSLLSSLTSEINNRGYLDVNVDIGQSVILRWWQWIVTWPVQIWTHHLAKCWTCSVLVIHYTFLILCSRANYMNWTSSTDSAGTCAILHLSCSLHSFHFYFSSFLFCIFSWTVCSSMTGSFKSALL